MPNIKSAIKRVSVTNKKNEQNKSVRTKITTYTKKFKNEIAQKNLEAAEKSLSEIVKILDSASKDNVIHKNSASRKQAHFSKLLDNAKKQK